MDWNPSARKRWSIPHPACFLLPFQLKHEVFRRFLYKLYGLDVRSNSRGLLQRQVQGFGFGLCSNDTLQG